MASQEFQHTHVTGLIVVGFILLIIAVLVISFMSFGQSRAQSQVRFPLNMKHSRGAEQLNARNRGNTMIIHDPNDEGEECDLDLNLRPNYKGRIGKRIMVKNNTHNSVVNLLPTDGLTLDTGFIVNGDKVKSGVLCTLLYTANNGLLRLQ